MIRKIFFFAFLAVAFAQPYPKENGYSDADSLKHLTEKGGIKLLETLEYIKNARNDYNSYAIERLNCLNWEGIVQKGNLNKTITEAVFKGMLKNKQFLNFQCVSSNAQDFFAKLERLSAEIPDNSQKLVEKGLARVTQYKIVVSSLLDYIQDFHNRKNEELNKAKNDADRKKIMEEVVKKMKLLEGIVEQMNGQIKEKKFKFIEEYINFAFTTENGLKNTQREGSQKIMKCVA